MLSSDLILDILRNLAPLCPGEYLEEQKAEMQHVFKLARIHNGKAVIKQKVTHGKKGLRDHDYKIGVCFDPPNLTDKITGQPYTGSYQVLDGTQDGNRVQLKLPEAFAEASMCIHYLVYFSLSEENLCLTSFRRLCILLSV